MHHEVIVEYFDLPAGLIELGDAVWHSGDEVSLYDGRFGE